MDYEKKYKQLHGFISDLYPHLSEYCKEKVDGFLPELKESNDEKIRKVLIDLVKCNERSGYKLLNNIPTSSMIAWLKKQGEQKPKRMISAEAKEAMYGKPAYAWNEEDEEMLRSIMATCELAEQERDSSPAKHLLQMQLNWLKSLKLKATWKPSDEQMEALFVLLPTVCNGNPAFSLYNNLKKLKGE